MPASSDGSHTHRVDKRLIRAKRSGSAEQIGDYRRIVALCCIRRHHDSRFSFV